MLKGQVFKEQIFENQIFAVFINTFLDGKDGIINGYKNSMAVTAGSNSVTVQSGAICIQGRFLEEDIGSTIATGTDTAFCSLVVEIDLDKVNTETDFAQGYYKVLKSTSNYPVLTKNDIVNTNSGVYQYELARFKTSLNGISDFVDLRSYIDYESLYKEIQSKLDQVEDESIYLLKTEFEKNYKKQLDNMHPIGSIYLSMLDTNPSEYFGGTWTQIAQGRMLVGVDPKVTDFNDSNKVGGSKEHTLTNQEMPSHTHDFIGSASSGTGDLTRDGSDLAIGDANGGPTWRYIMKPEHALSTSTTRFKTTVSITPKGTNKSAGGGSAFNIMNPYLTCYIWQRTA